MRRYRLVIGRTGEMDISPARSTDCGQLTVALRLAHTAWLIEREKGEQRRPVVVTDMVSCTRVASFS